jgi:hypothetical protein
LRTPDVPAAEAAREGEADATTLPAFLTEGEDDDAGDPHDPEEPEPHAVAAE